MKEVTLDFLLRIFRAFNLEEFMGSGDDLLWRTDGEYAPLTIWINCSDFFMWGCADNEEITPENIHLLEESITDLKKFGVEYYGSLLFCCRARKMAPMSYWIKQADSVPEEAKKLFLSCGPQAE